MKAVVAAAGLVGLLTALFGAAVFMRTSPEAKPKMPEKTDIDHTPSAKNVPAPDTPQTHFVNGHPLLGPFPGMQTAYFGMGCFWGAERRFWQIPGVYTTAVGYAGGTAESPSYQLVCSGLTGHAEIVMVVYDPKQVSYEDLLKAFWESHDPTQGNRQGNDHGTQYRSCLYWTTEEQRQLAEASRDEYAQALEKAGRGPITTELRPAPTFYYAEEYHQQYLGKNPNGYCGLQGTGVSCPASFATAPKK
jgi:peptide-methionine (S)-S-oxide reductase